MSKRESYKEQTFRELYESNYPMMFRLAFSLVADSDAAKDIVDDVFAMLWKNFDPDNKYESFFLLKSIRNTCINYLRHEQVKTNFARIYREKYANGTLHENDDDERIELVMKVIHEMPPRTQFVMEQCYLEEKKYTEVAELLGITTSGVKNHIVKGLSMLRNAFSVNYKKGQIPKKDK